MALDPVGLSFDETTHVYRVNGAVWPSVTQVLDPLQTLDGVNADVLRRAAQFGTHVHQACDLFNRGMLDEADLDHQLAPYLAAWKQYLHDRKVTVIASEIRCLHRSLRYAGTCDAVVTFGSKKGSRHPLDIKSSTTVPRTVGPQTAAYRAALIDGKQCGGFISNVRYAVQLRGDGTYRQHKLDNTADMHVFQSALNLFHWRQTRQPIGDLA